MPEDPSTLAGATRSDLALTHPLDDFYARSGEHLPPLSQIDAEAVPEPYRALLVHRNDMTPTLEKFHGADIHLRVLGRRRKDEEYFREVALLLDGSNRPVEFGAIKINLALFTAPVREQILAEQRPLGHILAEHKVPHRSEPRAFFRLASDRLMNEALQLSGAQILFGRRNSLLDPQGRALAEIFEILPPVPRSA
jgi:chorismate-pyruvate lyase